MATYTEANARDRVWSILRDYGSSTDQQLMNDTEILSLGVRGAEPIYSRIRPRIVIADLNATGTAYLSLPVGFMEGFSSIESIEQPPDKVPPEVRDARTYYIGRDSLGALRIVWLDTVPAAGTANVRIAYTSTRILASSAANTTVLDIDFTAICDLAASICADSIAAKYARTSESAFNADAVNFRTRAQEWQSIAKRLWSRWESGMGMGGDGAGSAPAASAWANWDSSASWGGARVNHPRLNR